MLVYHESLSEWSKSAESRNAATITTWRLSRRYRGRPNQVCSDFSICLHGPKSLIGFGGFLTYNVNHVITRWLENCIAVRSAHVIARHNSYGSFFRSGYHGYYSIARMGDSALRSTHQVRALLGVCDKWQRYCMHCLLAKPRLLCSRNIYLDRHLLHIWILAPLEMYVGGLNHIGDSLICKT
ncbi:hypothetical protein BD289DRAFT_8313 [Coniella lustricola]|uniref:Uncharacterized protein n=1 Tax=Coniella lustricola TaxID=2025994 RepID=A0A2T3AJR1_9PEZI|nr:hypothetical protein BD289DRAFT_8313 [Coniella lustricola]